MQQLFGTQAVPLFEGMLVIGVGVVFVALIEIEKQLSLRIVSSEH